VPDKGRDKGAQPRDRKRAVLGLWVWRRAIAVAIVALATANFGRAILCRSRADGGRSTQQHLWAPSCLTRFAPKLEGLGA